MARKPDDTPSIAAALKDQLTLVSFLVLFAGVVSTETYYAAFGIRYQLLDFPVQHLIYRGITALLGSWALAAAYLLAMAWLAAGAAWLGARGPAAARWAQLATYGVLIVVVAIAYPTAIAAGRAAAQRDLGPGSELPTVRAIFDPAGRPLPYQKHRLLLAGKDTLALFEPVASANAVPFIHLLRREAVGEIVVTR